MLMSCRIVIQVSCLLLSACAASGAEAKLNRSILSIPERGDVLAYTVSVDTNHFQFIPPPEWRVAAEPGTSAVVMMSPGLATSIKIDFLDGNLVRGRQKNRHEKLLAERYPSSTSRERFAAQTGLGEGPASDIERKAADGSLIISRVIHARHRSAVIEFALTAPARKFPGYAGTFAIVVNSFKATAAERQ